MSDRTAMSEIKAMSETKAMSVTEASNDMSRFGKVALLYGGISAEREVSLQSGDAVYTALRAQGIDVHKVDANPDNIGQLQAQGFDRVFVVLHGTWGEDGVVQGALQAINMPFTGSSVLGCALAMDKVRSKQIWQANGLPTADYKVLESEADLAGTVEQLGLPLFLKPVTEGSSVGVGKVSRIEELEPVWQAAAQAGLPVIAEKFIPGAELTVSILNDQALPAIRMQTSNEFYDYQAKYESDETQYHCPAGLSEELESEIRALAVQAFHQLGCSGWGRVDMMLDKHERPQLLEANTVPGMTSHSLVPMAAAAVGINFESLVLQILEATL